MLLEGKIILSQGDAIKKIDGAFVKFDKTDSNYLSWMTKELVFDDMLISEALIEIFHHFNVPVKLDGSIYQSNCRLSTKFRTESLDQILVELKTVVKLSFSKEDTNTYILKTVSCE